MPWKDKKKRYDSDEIESSEINLGCFRLTVHRHIHYPPDVWLASCTNLFSQIELASKDLDEAKCQAKAKVQVLLENALKDILEA
jgi:hypothetical protein